MMLSKEQFPYRPLGPAQRDYIYKVCGQASCELASVQEYLRLGGLPLADKSPIDRFLEKAKEAVLPLVTVTASGTHQANRSFNRGALLYTAILRDVTGVRRLPAEPSTLVRSRRLAAQQPGDYLAACYEAATRIPSFPEVLDSLSPPLLAPGSPDRHVALIGAGAVHMLVTASEQAAQDIDDLTTAFPDLVTELADSFEHIERTHSGGQIGD